MSLDFYLRVDDGGDGWVDVFDANYTHNVAPMWTIAGVYDALYESDGRVAQDLIPTLRYGIAEMVEHPVEFAKLNPENGWGDSVSALAWLRSVLAACEKYPRSIVNVSR